jgi:hypothetical protein
VEYELRLARVNTNTRWGHPASLTSWKGQEKKYWKGGGGVAVSSRSGRELKLTVTTRSSTRVTSSPARFKNKKRTGFSTPRWNEIGKQNMTWDKIHPKTINSSLYFRKRIKKKDKRILPGAWPVEAPHATVEQWHGNRLWRWPASTLWHAVPSIIIGRPMANNRNNNNSQKEERRKLLFEKIRAKVDIFSRVSGQKRIQQRPILITATTKDYTHKLTVPTDEVSSSSPDWIFSFHFIEKNQKFRKKFSELNLFDKFL